MTESKGVKSNFDYEKSLKNDPHPHLVSRFFKFNRFIYRPVASLLVRLLLLTAVGPNQVTVFAFLFGMAGALGLVTGEYSYLVLGAVLIQVSQLLDLADGMLARIKNMSSSYGAYLDLFLDRVTDFLILTSLVGGYYRAGGDLELFILGMFGTSLYFLQVCLFYITNQFLKKEKTGETEEARAFFMLALLVFCILDRVDILIYIILLQTVLNVTIRSINLIFIKKKL